MSSLANRLIDGFAAYGRAFYPPFYAIEETEDLGERQWNRGLQQRHEIALLRNNPWLCEDLREPAESHRSEQ